MRPHLRFVGGLWGCCLPDGIGKVGMGRTIQMAYSRWVAVNGLWTPYTHSRFPSTEFKVVAERGIDDPKIRRQLRWYQRLAWRLGA